MLVKNGAEDLKTSLPSIADWMDEIIILDSGSTDDSASIANKYGAKRYVSTDLHEPGKQRQLAQSYATGDWILALDANEEVSQDLKTSILTAIQQKPANTVYGCKRLDYLFGHCIDNPFWGAKAQWRLYPRSFSYNDDNHESVILGNAHTKELNGFLLHHTAHSPKAWLEKHMDYALAWAHKKHSQKQRTGFHNVILNPLWALIKQYLLAGRFLQGKYGFIYSLFFMQYTFNKYAILYDLTHNKAKLAFDTANKLNRTLARLDLSQKKSSLSLVMIVKNESKHLAACLDSIHDLTDEIILLDSGSSDDTRNIADKYQAKFYSNTVWQGFGKQRQIAQSYASGDYVLVLDADERVDAQLRQSILEVLNQPLQADKVFAVSRVNLFCGVEVPKRYWYTNKIARLYANQSFSYSNQEVHESLDHKNVRSENLNGYLLHLTNDNLHDSLAKNIRYSSDWAKEKKQKGKKKSFIGILFSTWASFLREYFLRGDIAGGAYGYLLAFASMSYTMDKYIMLWVDTKKKENKS
ncbi:MAG: glycosyl transferase [Gammaproteobacteria bacterium]|nr:MAG: glycosyl transferase [Gammaproteobacteria bacterium]